MKKNTMMRVASALLVAVLLSTCAISGTFAKYTSTASGSDTARVAKWSIEVNDTTNDIAVGNPSITFDLFNTVNDTANPDANDADVVDDANVAIIAPGTTGSYTLDIWNTSEVTAKYAIEFEVVSNTNNIPIQYSLDGSTWKNTIAEIKIVDSDATTLPAQNGAKSETVYWRWAFDEETSGKHPDQTNAKDTALGITADDATAPSITIKATITATQVD